MNFPGLHAFGNTYHLNVELGKHLELTDSWNIVGPILLHCGAQLAPR